MANRSLLGQLVTFVIIFIVICMIIVAIPLILLFLIVASLFPGSRSFVKNKKVFINRKMDRKPADFFTERQNMPPNEEIIDVTAQEVKDESN